MIGGGLGAIFRYGLFMTIHRISSASFPSGTLAANLLGSLLIGFLWQMFEGTRLAHEWRLFIFTGFLGGFTTFSTFTRETTQLLKVGEWKTALTYMFVSNTLGITLVICGYLLARRFMFILKWRHLITDSEIQKLPANIARLGENLNVFFLFNRCASFSFMVFFYLSRTNKMNFYTLSKPDLKDL